MEILILPTKGVHRQGLALSPWIHDYRRISENGLDFQLLFAVSCHDIKTQVAGYENQFAKNSFNSNRLTIF
jgi:hypothetical protein